MEPKPVKYIYNWKNNPVRRMYFGKTCNIIANGKANIVIVRFEDGLRMETKRQALRRIYN